MQHIMTKTIVLLLSLFIATSAFAHGKRDPAKRAEHMTKEIAEELKLTTEQEVKVKEIVTNILTVGQQSRQDYKKSLEEFQNVWDKETLTKEDLAPIEANAQTHFDNYKTTLRDSMIEFHALLTPEQRAEAKDEMKHLFKGMGRGNHRGKKRGGWFNWMSDDDDDDKMMKTK